MLLKKHLESEDFLPWPESFYRKILTSLMLLSSGLIVLALVNYIGNWF